MRATDRIAQPNMQWNSSSPDPGSSTISDRLYNRENHQPVELMQYIEAIGQCVGKKAENTVLPLRGYAQPMR